MKTRVMTVGLILAVSAAVLAIILLAGRTQEANYLKKGATEGFEIDGSVSYFE